MAISLATTILAMTLGSTTQAYAAISTYSDKTLFLTDTGATSEGALPNIGVVPGGAAATLTVGDATYSLGPSSLNFYSGAVPSDLVTNDDWTLRLPGADIAISGIEELNVDLTSPVLAFGIDFVEPQFDPNVNAPFAESEFTVTLKNGVTTVDSFTFDRPNDVAAFVGVWSDAPFDRVEIRETTGDVENEFFGQVYTGTTPPSKPVGGEFLSVDTTALFVAGTFANAYWILPAIGAVIAGFLIRTRLQK